MCHLLKQFTLSVLLGYLSVGINIAQAQTISAMDNQTLKVNISAKETTRIAVDQDRITVFRGVENAYTYSNDTQNGAVFLKPTEAYQTKPFYVFITTEKNHNYVLALKPQIYKSAEMLILKPHTISSTSLSTSLYGLLDEQDSNIHKITQLIRDMVTGNFNEDYEVIPVNAAQTIPVGTQLRLRLKTIYQGDTLKGSIYEIINTTLFPVSLSESIFYKPKILAIALKDETIPAEGKTLLYTIRGE